MRVDSKQFEGTRCPTKHKNVYKTSFGQTYCPDCKRNVVPMPKVTKKQIETLKVISEGLSQRLEGGEKHGSI